MELQIVNREIAIKLKELGFDWYCERYYFSDNNTSSVDSTILLDNWNKRKDYKSAPTQPLVCKWFRDVKHIKVIVKHSDIGTYNYEIRIVIESNQIGKWERIGNINSYDTYELAEEAGILKAIEILKEKDNEK